jgi:hypothetical protein
MGNVMFQYAFGYAASRSLGCSWELTDTSHLKYFSLIDYSNPLQSIRRKLSHWYYRISRKLDLLESRRKVTIPSDLEPHLALNSVNDNQVYSGFFQSELYFEEYKQDIIRNFQITPEYRTVFDKKYKQLYDDRFIVAVHIRRSDYVGWELSSLNTVDPTLPPCYYRNCFESIEFPANITTVFVGDDLEFAKHELGYWPNCRFERNHAIIDFQILLNADVVVVSNSTFAWWAAYLNSQAAKNVYAPKYWLGFKAGIEYPAQIVCPSWIEVDCM